MEAQVIHLKVTIQATRVCFWISYVYGFNRKEEREALWCSLEDMAAQQFGPSIICGDFNNVLHDHERIGSRVVQAEISRFQSCVQRCSVVDMAASGAFFTWTNKQEGSARVYSRIDRALINDEWVL